MKNNYEKNDATSTIPDLCMKTLSISGRVHPRNAD